MPSVVTKAARHPHAHPRGAWTVRIHLTAVNSSLSLGSTRLSPHERGGGGDK